MSRINRLFPALVVGVVFVAGCRDEGRAPTDPQPELAPTTGAAAAESRDGTALVRPHEEQFHKLSQQIKGFGGYYFDEAGNMVALLADGADEKMAYELLYPILRARTPTARERGGGTLVLQKAQYSFLDLAAIRDRASDPVLDIEEVQYTDLDEIRNRFVVGVSGPSAQEQALKVLREQGVPLEAVTFETSKPVEELLTLRDYARPIEGGFQIQRAGGGTCTLGFNAYWAGMQTFLTNSHCTNQFWKTDGVSIYQNDTAPASNVVGYEVHDPSAFSCGFLGWYACRWSDAAVIRKYGSVPSNYARIARTTFWGTGAGVSGSITVNPNNPRMTITGEYAFPVGGEMFDKMGRTTGWTYGFVKKTCVDVNKSGMRRVLCQDFIHKMHATFGDSGSPIFRWHGNTVTLAGLLWGGTEENGVPLIIMSAMWNIEKDIGALSTF